MSNAGTTVAVSRGELLQLLDDVRSELSGYRSPDDKPTDLEERCLAMMGRLMRKPLVE